MSVGKLLLVFLFLLGPFLVAPDCGGLAEQLAQLDLEHAVKLRDPALLILIERLVIQMGVADKNIVHGSKYSGTMVSAEMLGTGPKLYKPLFDKKRTVWLRRGACPHFSAPRGRQYGFVAVWWTLLGLTVTGNLVELVFEVHRILVAEGAVDTHPVVKGFHVLEDLGLAFLPAAELAAMHAFDFQG